MTRLSQNGRRALMLLVTATVAVGLATGAFGYWTASGTGTATTVLESPVQVSLDPGVAQAQLSPGHAASVALVATNPNPYFVQISSLALDPSAGTGGFDVDAAHTGCDLSALDLAARDNDGAGWRVPPQVASTDGTLAIAMTDALSMDADAPSACQGATFTVHVVAGA